MAIIIKTPEQIEGIRKSCKLAAEILQWVEEKIVPGVSTQEINDLIEVYTQEKGAISAPLGYKGFPKSVCTSLNEVICHGIPDATVLKDGDILNIDVTPILDGYYGDTCRMYAVGEVSDESKELMKVTKECLGIGIEQVRPGNYFGEIGYHIAKHAESHGYSVVQEFTGHGVGVYFHEPPHIPHKSRRYEGGLMKAGMIFTIEPMINVGESKAYIDESDKWTARTIDGRLSAQYEHSILVTESGHEILTKLKE